MKINDRINEFMNSKYPSGDYMVYVYNTYGEGHASGVYIIKNTEASKRKYHKITKLMLYTTLSR